MSKSILSFLLFFALALPCASHADESPEIIAAKPEWLALLHILPSGRSIIKDPNFFLAPDGLQNPVAELLATIVHFKNQDHESLCRFPARLLWLRTQLQEINVLPVPSCPEQETWYNAIAPESATLIFASSFLNNPASAFGHTFLRLNQADEKPLLSYAANYAAATNGENAFLYAYKGVFGGYQGFFSVAPYYQRVSKYSDLENRDMWEYQLDFSPEQVELMVKHIWELKNIPIAYFYFDENCSYQLLFLIDVARPDLHLIEQTGPWVIPIDTVRLVKPIIGAATFRPSAATQLRHRLEYISHKDATDAVQLADLNEPVIDASPEALDAAYDLITYRKIKGTIDGESAKQRSWELLVARGAKKVPDSVPALPVPTIRPEDGHKTLKTTFAVERHDDRWGGQVTMRPAFHSLLDLQDGYQPGSQIKFLETALRYEEESNVALDYLTVLDITSLTPRDEYFKPLSWNVRLGTRRTETEDKDDSQTPYFGGGAGVSYGLDGNIFFGMIDGELRANPHNIPEWNAGVGPKVGVVATLTDAWSIQSEVSFKKFDGDTSFETGITQRYAVNSNFSLFQSTTYVNEFERIANKTLVGLEIFVNP